MEDKKIETVIKNSGKKISFLEWLFLKNQHKISLEVPRTSFDYLNDTLQTT